MMSSPNPPGYKYAPFLSHELDIVETGAKDSGVVVKRVHTRARARQLTHTHTPTPPPSLEIDYRVYDCDQHSDLSRYAGGSKT